MIDRIDSETRNAIKTEGCLAFVMALIYALFMCLFLLWEIIIPYVECRGIKSPTCDKFHSGAAYGLIQNEVGKYRRP